MFRATVTAYRRGCPLARRRNRAAALCVCLHMPSAPKWVASCSLAILLALYVVGAVSVPPGSLRHEVQTLPLWLPIVLGFQKRDIAKWMALPLFVFWLVLMMLIWLFLLACVAIWGFATREGGLVHWLSIPIAIASIGLAVGQKAPAFSLRDQSGGLQTLDTLRGTKGTVLLFFRSADW